MVNFGPLAAEIASLVWGTPANFNGFRVLAVLLHGTLVVGVSQTAAFNRGRHLYSAGRPSHWALAHISSYVTVLNVNLNYVIDRAEFLILLLIFRMHQGLRFMCEVHSVKLAFCCVNSILFKVTCCLWTLFLCIIQQPLYGRCTDVPFSHPTTVSEHWMEHWC